MTINQIYNKYKILPSLQLHQKRVASVAWLIYENLEVEVNLNEIIKATLLHDMGNIIKFNLSVYPEFLEPEGLEYWQKIKNEFIQKYGPEEHIATKKIVEEITKEGRVIELVNSIGFSKAPEILKSEDFSKKIANYSDHRVGPKGILSLSERIEDGDKRFAKNKNLKNREEEKKKSGYFEMRSAVFELEKQVFKLCSIKPNEINDKSIAKYLLKVEEISI